MAFVTIYTTRFCPYCAAARTLLLGKEIAFTEVDVTGDAEARRSLAVRAGGRSTVPQVFIDDVHIGGCDDLHMLADIGKLDDLLRV